MQPSKAARASQRACSPSSGPSPRRDGAMAKTAVQYSRPVSLSPYAHATVDSKSYTPRQNMDCSSSCVCVCDSVRLWSSKKRTTRYQTSCPTPWSMQQERAWQQARWATSALGKKRAWDAYVRTALNMLARFTRSVLVNSEGPEI